MTYKKQQDQKAKVFTSGKSRHNKGFGALSAWGGLDLCSAAFCFRSMETEEY